MAAKCELVLPGPSSGPRESEIGFVDERRGLDGLSRRFVPNIARRGPAQLVIHQRHQKRGCLPGGGIRGVVLLRPATVLSPRFEK